MTMCESGIFCCRDRLRFSERVSCRTRSLHMRFYHHHRKMHLGTPAHRGQQLRLTHARSEPQVIRHSTPSMPIPAHSSSVLLGQHHNPQPPGNSSHLTKPQEFLDTWTDGRVKPDLILPQPPGPTKFSLWDLPLCRGSGTA